MFPSGAAASCDAGPMPGTCAPTHSVRGNVDGLSPGGGPTSTHAIGSSPILPVTTQVGPSTGCTNDPAHTLRGTAVSPTRESRRRTQREPSSENVGDHTQPWRSTHSPCVNVV